MRLLFAVVSAVMILVVSACGGSGDGSDDDPGDDQGAADAQPDEDAQPMRDASIDDGGGEDSNLNCRLSMTADQAAGVPPESWELRDSLRFMVYDLTFEDRTNAVVHCTQGNAGNPDADPVTNLAISIQFRDQPWADLVDQVPLQGDQDSPGVLVRADYLYAPDGGQTYSWSCPDFDGDQVFSWEITEVIPHDVEPPWDVNLWHVHGSMRAECGANAPTPPTPGRVTIEAVF
jgi:hypothetical protein